MPVETALNHDYFRGLSIEAIRALVLGSWRTIGKSPGGGEKSYYPSGFDGRKEFDGLVRLMESVSQKYLVPSQSRFLDLGSGDGTIVFLARYYDFDYSYGIERNPDLVRVSRGYSGRLGLTEKVKIIEGDWKTREPFDTLGVPFEDMDFIYIYPSFNGLQIAFDMVSDMSKEGSILAVKSSSESDKAKPPSNLIPVDTITGIGARIFVYKKA